MAPRSHQSFSLPCSSPVLVLAPVDPCEEQRQRRAGSSPVQNGAFFLALENK